MDYPTLLKTLFISLFIGACTAHFADAQMKTRIGKAYYDVKIGTIYLPLGEFSFADRVVDFDEGNPAAKGDKDYNRILNVPDYTKNASVCAATLGCHGSITVQFTNNALVDVEGIDLYVFEIGSDIEPTSLEISRDGYEWKKIGKIKGGKTGIDISPFVEKDEAYYYLRLTDLGTNCYNSYWPGADIDAIASVGSAIHIRLQHTLAFETAKAEPSAEFLEKVDFILTEVQRFKKARVIIEGHTDNIGDDDSNLQLSQARAEAVKNLLAPKLSPVDYLFEVKALGETKPIADNSTEAGREKNRRVEILIFPNRKERIRK